MRFFKTSKLIGFAILCIVHSSCFGQGDWNTAGNLLSGTGILGSNTNFDILFQTNGINRMRLMETGNVTIDDYTIPVGGHLGLSLTPAFFGTGTAGRSPYSLLHLNGFQNAAGGAQAFGYRDWMRPGITFTHNADLMYVGPKVGPGGQQDITDAVIAWSDNDQAPAPGPDVLRFLFTSQGSGTNAVSSDPFNDNDYDGVEIARMHGNGRMGVGVNWNNTLQPIRTLDVIDSRNLPQMRLTRNQSTNPTGGQHSDFQVSSNGDLYIKPESNGAVRAVAIGFLTSDIPGTAIEAPQAPLGVQTLLDVNGLTRIRDLRATTNNNDCIIIGQQAAGSTANDNYLKRIDFTGNSNEYLAGDATWQEINSLDCRWEDIISVTGIGNSDIMLGFDPEYECYRQNVVIGANGAKSKLAVEARTDRDNSPVGVAFDMTDSEPTFDAVDNADIVVALKASSEGVNTENGTSYAGIQSRAVFGKYAVGIDVEANTGAERSIGVYAKASGSLNSINSANIGVYSEVPSQTDVCFFAVGGNPVISGSPILISDAGVKVNSLPIIDASSLLNQLTAKTYNYASPENRPIAFEEGIQFGFIAQEVQDVIPEIVKGTVVPELRDSLGGFIEGTSVELLGVQYEKLIPILVAGFQEQNVVMAAQIQENEALEAQVADLSEQLEAQAAQMAEMQSQMAEVMSSFQSTQSKMNNCCGTAHSEKENSETGAISLEQNFPNPFDEITTINFSINEPAQIRLEISDSQGRVLEVLVNQTLTEGRYTERWDASAFAPGTYYYSLYADTELLTKKMIKR